MSADEEDMKEIGHGLLWLSLFSLLAGMATGFLGALFRRLLLAADHTLERLLAWSHHLQFTGVDLVDQFLGATVVVLTTAATTATAAWLVRQFSPEASGSGIPHVEGVLRERFPAARPVLIPVKFVGGLLAIGSGLALGREGPTVQMGATIAHILGTYLRLTPADARILLGAGAGAGLAAAFNAPIAGSVFVLEELRRRFDTRITITTLGASATAIAVSQFFLGVAPDFQLPAVSDVPIGSLGSYLVLGALLGVLGMTYNRAIVAALAAAGWLSSRVCVEAQAGTVGGLVGLLAWWAPNWVGGGEPIVQQLLTGPVVLEVLPILLLVRFALGAVSYAVKTPGGLFAPMLVLGAQAGALYGLAACRWFPQYGTEVTPYIVTGMAAFFTAVVRAPVTGIILIIELTGWNSQLLPMLAACFTAMLVPTLCGNRPIYDTLATLPVASSRRA